MTPGSSLADLPALDIESVDHEGRGVGRVDGKVLFVEGGITGERVRYRMFLDRDRHAFAAAQAIERTSALRVTPRCPYTERCGGCSMQHIDSAAQVAIKQRVLEENLRRLGGVLPEFMLPPIQGESWGYRHRARLSVRFVPRKGEVLIGFNDRRSHHVVDMQSCAILPARVSAALAPLRALMTEFSSRARIAQVELSVGEEVTVFLLRNLVPLQAEEREALLRFGEEHGIEFQLQPKGPASVHPLREPAGGLSYILPEFDLTLRFGPLDFTQINYGVNRILVRRAVAMLDPRPGERVLDLFCGLGNFSLPLARRGADVLGIEGSEAMVQRARDNAASNGLASRTQFSAADLTQITAQDWERFGPIDKLLIDPPRQGAAVVIDTLPAQGIDRIVYISCNAATLARDAGTLVREKGYRLAAAGVVNMFPHTSHVESMALFERDQ